MGDGPQLRPNPGERPDAGSTEKQSGSSLKLEDLRFNGINRPGEEGLVIPSAPAVVKPATPTPRTSAGKDPLRHTTRILPSQKEQLKRKIDEAEYVEPEPGINSGELERFLASLGIISDTEGTGRMTHPPSWGDRKLWDINDEKRLQAQGVRTIERDCQGHADWGESAVDGFEDMVDRNDSRVKGNNSESRGIEDQIDDLEANPLTWLAGHGCLDLVGDVKYTFALLGDNARPMFTDHPESYDSYVEKWEEENVSTIDYLRAEQIKRTKENILILKALIEQKPALEKSQELLLKAEEFFKRAEGDTGVVSAAAKEALYNRAMVTYGFAVDALRIRVDTKNEEEAYVAAVAELDRKHQRAMYCLDRAETVLKGTRKTVLIVGGVTIAVMTSGAGAPAAAWILGGTKTGATYVALSTGTGFVIGTASGTATVAGSSYLSHTTEGLTGNALGLPEYDKYTQGHVMGLVKDDTLEAMPAVIGGAAAGSWGNYKSLTQLNRQLTTLQTIIRSGNAGAIMSGTASGINIGKDYIYYPESREFFPRLRDFVLAVGQGWVGGALGGWGARYRNPLSTGVNPTTLGSFSAATGRTVVSVPVEMGADFALNYAYYSLWKKDGEWTEEDLINAFVTILPAHAVGMMTERIDVHNRRRAEISAQKAAAENQVNAAQRRAASDFKDIPTSQDEIVHNNLLKEAPPDAVDPKAPETQRRRVALVGGNSEAEIDAAAQGMVRSATEDYHRRFVEPSVSGRGKDDGSPASARRRDLANLRQEVEGTIDEQPVSSRMGEDVGRGKNKHVSDLKKEVPETLEALSRSGQEVSELEGQPGGLRKFADQLMEQFRTRTRVEKKTGTPDDPTLPQSTAKRTKPNHAEIDARVRKAVQADVDAKWYNVYRRARGWLSNTRLGLGTRQYLARLSEWIGFGWGNLKDLASNIPRLMSLPQGFRTRIARLPILGGLLAEGTHHVAMLGGAALLGGVAFLAIPGTAGWAAGTYLAFKLFGKVAPPFWRGFGHGNAKTLNTGLEYTVKFEKTTEAIELEVARLRAESQELVAQRKAAMEADSPDSARIKALDAQLKANAAEITACERTVGHLRGHQQQAIKMATRGNNLPTFLFSQPLGYLNSWFGPLLGKPFTRLIRGSVDGDFGLSTRQGNILHKPGARRRITDAYRNAFDLGNRFSEQAYALALYGKIESLCDAAPIARRGHSREAITERRDTLTKRLRDLNRHLELQEAHIKDEAIARERRALIDPLVDRLRALADEDVSDPFCLGEARRKRGNEDVPETMRDDYDTLATSRREEGATDQRHLMQDIEYELAVLERLVGEDAARVIRENIGERLLAKLQEDLAPPVDGDNCVSKMAVFRNRQEVFEKIVPEGSPLRERARAELGQTFATHADAQAYAHVPGYYTRLDGYRSGPPRGDGQGPALAIQAALRNLGGNPRPLTFEGVYRDRVINDKLIPTIREAMLRPSGLGFEDQDLAFAMLASMADDARKLLPREYIQEGGVTKRNVKFDEAREKIFEPLIREGEQLRDAMRDEASRLDAADPRAAELESQANVIDRRVELLRRVSDVDKFVFDELFKLDDPDSLGRIQTRLREVDEVLDLPRREFILTKLRDLAQGHVDKTIDREVASLMNLEDGARLARLERLLLESDEGTAETVRGIDEKFKLIKEREAQFRDQNRLIDYLRNNDQAIENLDDFDAAVKQARSYRSNSEAELRTVLRQAVEGSDSPAAQRLRDSGEGWDLREARSLLRLDQDAVTSRLIELRGDRVDRTVRDLCQRINDLDGLLRRAEVDLAEAILTKKDIDRDLKDLRKVLEEALRKSKAPGAEELRAQDEAWRERRETLGKWLTKSEPGFHSKVRMLSLNDAVRGLGTNGGKGIQRGVEVAAPDPAAAPPTGGGGGGAPLPIGPSRRGPVIGQAENTVLKDL